MASHHTTLSNDTPVAVKTTIIGKDDHRKFKLTLKDLGPSVLPEKLRHLLSIDPTKDAVFERYSDSSASFITLDSSNQQVYKQLFRAAKAKGKLRLRVTIVDKPSQNHSVSETPTGASERLPSRSYVHPYVSETLLDQSPSSRISMLEDFKTLSAAPSTITLTPFTQVSAESQKETKPHPCYWPISDDKGFSEATKAKFEKKSSEPQANKERKLENDGEAEAPVPRFFSARGQCLANLANVQQKHAAERNASKCPMSSNFFLSCNRCDNSIPDTHWHCGVCEKGDFDLCLACVQKGSMCDNDKHWLIKRFFKNGEITNSTTETLGPKGYSGGVPGAFASEAKNLYEQAERTCNACVQIFPEAKFVTCTLCDDYDLCLTCHIVNKHGHNPGHGFKPATKEVELNSLASKLLKPGRDIRHAAICDGCDQSIYGIRHKCLKCPDWDFCGQCFLESYKTHPGHRFASLQEPIPHNNRYAQEHFGISCDGPLCEGQGGYIMGDRYKCAVCNDTDFCARCEAFPTLKHNRTHPLLKFKTPVRNVSVSTYGEKASGESMRPMGDQAAHVSSKSTETTPLARSANAATQVQPTTEVKLSKRQVMEKKPARIVNRAQRSSWMPPHLQAHFVRDTVADGSIVAPNTQFTQTWTLQNVGQLPWPAGCSVAFVGGDSMLDVESNHPSSIEQLRNAMSTNTVDRLVEAGELIDFSVSMRTPEREGKAISYWRLKAADGTPFGHKLWCDVTVQKPAKQEEAIEPKLEAETVELKPDPEVKVEEEQPKSSQMIFPVLDKESPVSSKHEAETSSTTVATAATLSPAEQDLLEDVESLELDDNDDESSEEGFLTDEEYELIASGDELEVAKNGKK
ncbi:uncharacterized protein KY384_006122 [Bacidia gigantensis]|uniref:uncharacterized protein n=1 Tax=Bacidia gigantensis TaxID=2732470 RepID=UPI001D05459F|nr:uncharacterized protein KY384_006122 [Bacidia gigantensis]KAG8529485.1 hypothetical protein KY384_006122 [Bacidia gigantensis]